MRVFMSYRFGEEGDSEVKVDESGRTILTREQFVHRVSYYLRKQPDLEVCCWSKGRHRLNWDEVIANELEMCDKFVLFLEHEYKFDCTQDTEVRTWVSKHRNDYHLNTVIVKFSADDEIPDSVLEMRQHELTVDKLVPDSAPQVLVDDQVRVCAKRIYERIHGKPEGTSDWIRDDGLPVGYPFDYEKDIIKEFVKGRGRLLTPNRLQQGCPVDWPEVDKISADHEQYYGNPIAEPTIGTYREESERIIVDARSAYHRRGGKPDPKSGEDYRCCLVHLGEEPSKELSFLEAGPREEICYPFSDDRDDLKVGIVVSGGIAPGINSVIAGICQRHAQYKNQQEKLDDDRRKSQQEESDDDSIRYQLTITMYRDGFSGMLAEHKVVLDDQTISERANQGGSIISTARQDVLLDTQDRVKRRETLDKLVDRLREDKIDILYVIGGDGSMRAAHAIWTRIQQRYESNEPHYKVPKQVSVVAVPKTMDNDILWVWQAFGFLSAVEKAKDFIAQLDTETKSNPRLCIMQLFGSDSGFVVSHTALASGVCMAALIPEVGFTMKKLSENVRKRLDEDYGGRKQRYGQSPYGIILLAETAIPRDVEYYIDNPDYKDLNLSEGEKKAIRGFIGSALLNLAADDDDHDDILDWHALSAKLCESQDGQNGDWQSLRSGVWDMLPPKIRHTIGYYSNPESGEPTEDVKSLIIRALNGLIQNHDLLENEDWGAQRSLLSNRINNLSECISFVRTIARRDKTASQKNSRKLEDFLKYLVAVRINRKERSNPLKPDPELKLHQLSTYPLPYEAKVALESLEALMSDDRLRKIATTLGTEDWKAQRDIWISSFKGHCGLLLPELAKMCNRLLLEEIFPGIIREKTVSGERRVHGQTPDALRSGGLKVVSAVLQSDIRNKMKKRTRYWKEYRVFVNEPRHLIRAIPPSVSDVIFGQRLGMLAVDNAMAGYTDFMVSQWMTEYVLVPLELVVLGRKRVPENGIFWKSVLANTGQLPTMV